VIWKHDGLARGCAWRRDTFAFGQAAAREALRDRVHDRFVITFDPTLRNQLAVMSSVSARDRRDEHDIRAPKCLGERIADGHAIRSTGDLPFDPQTERKSARRKSDGD